MKKKTNRPKNAMSKRQLRKESDAHHRPCLIPDQHVKVCTCYGVETKRHSSHYARTGEHPTK